MKKLCTWLTLLAMLTLTIVGCQNKPKEKEPENENNYEYEYEEEKANPASDFEYEENEDGGITITRYGGKSADVVIPEKIDGKTVTVIGDMAFAFSGAAHVKTLTMSPGIKTVEMQAFQNCENLQNVTFSPNLETIEVEAFIECIALESIELPDSLKEIGYRAFYGCTSLKYLFIPKSITKWEPFAFAHTGIEKVDLEEGMTVLGEAAIRSTRITELVIPASLKAIPAGLCTNCDKLTKVTLPEGLESIESTAFANTGLTEIVIPSTVTSATELAFSPNEHLQKVTFMGDAPEGFVDDELNFQVGRSSGDFTVYYQKDAKGFSTPRWNGYKAAPVGSEPKLQMEGDFEYAVNADDTVTVVSYEGDDIEVIVPDKIAGKAVTVIGSKAFAYEESITSVKLPDTVTEIGFGAFALCSGVTSVNLPADLQTIGDYAFNMCFDLAEINLPKTLTKIGTYAFANCQAVKTLCIPATVREIGANSFMGMGMGSDTLELTLEEGIEVIGDWFYSAEMQTIVLPSSVKRIEEGAFTECGRLTSVTLNEGLTSIGDFAFENCINLKEIVIPSTVTEMSVLTFHDCSKLKAVKFEGNAPAPFWKDHPEDDEVRPVYDVYRHQEATGFDADEWGWFDIGIW